jgi:hypothetical protein
MALGFPGGRRRERRERAREAAARTRLALARGHAEDLIHFDASSYEADRRVGAVLAASDGTIITSRRTEAFGWPSGRSPEALARSVPDVRYGPTPWQRAQEATRRDPPESWQ